MGPRGVTARDLTRLRGVSDPRISPDGARVAFVVTTASDERDEYLSNVWMVDVAGGEPRRFTTGATRDTLPRWSPDGRWLAFLSDRGPRKKAQLHVVAAAGGEAIALTDLAHGVLGTGGLSWSPDATRIAFTALVGGWQEPERVEDRGKSRPARVITTLKYRYEGLGLTHDLRAHVFTVPASGAEAPTPLTSGDFDHGGPTWSPDGASIALVAERHATRDVDVVQGLYLVPAAGGEPRLVSPTLRRMWAPRFSPDGRAIAYAGMRVPEDGHNFLVYVQPIDGGDAVCVSDLLDRSAWDMVPPAWSADGESILYVGRDHGTYPLYRARAKGGEPPSAIVAGRRCVTGFSVARETGALAYTVTDATSPAELFACSADGSGERRLTDLNGPWKAEVELSAPARFTFVRAGYDIDGWVMRPVPFDPTRRYPALLWIHGGPHREYNELYSHEFQLQAAAGYAIVYLNPRGSQGYGEAFSRACVGDWGGEDYADLMAGLDEARRRHPFIDGDRLGVIGVSYGGFMTSWVVGHTGRFKAACAEAAINNVATQVGTSDIGFHWTIAEQGGAAPWDDPERYLRRSPLTYARDITTPLLIVHGEADLRCHVVESEQLFVALKKLGRDVVFVRMPDAGHGFGAVGRPRQRLERYRIILDWFAKHLACDSGPP
jgi:dipeptidyl aminopeptidase/acylaminoacyl peptidase